MSTQAFKGCSIVDYVEIMHTSLTHIAEDTFEDLQELISLKLSKNKLVALPENLFTKNTQLQYFHAYDNLLSSIDIAFRSSMIHIGLKINREVAEKCSSPMKKALISKDKTIEEQKARWVEYQKWIGNEKAQRGSQSDKLKIDSLQRNLSANNFKTSERHHSLFGASRSDLRRHFGRYCGFYEKFKLQKAFGKSIKTNEYHFDSAELKLMTILRCDAMLQKDEDKDEIYCELIICL